MTSAARPFGRITGVIAGMALLLAGCGTGQSATPDPSASESTSTMIAEDRPTHSGPTVTVPGLPGESSSAETPPGSAEPSASASASPVAGATASADVPSATTPSAAPPSSATSQPATTAEQAPTTPPPATTQPPATASPASPAAPTSNPASVTVQPCAGCEVLGTASDVAGGFNAALVRTANGRAALATLDGSGKAAGGISVPFGATFSTPFGGVLPCDDDGFCVVIATQTDGHAIASAYRMLSSGSWQDVSGDEAFGSETADARAVDVNGDGALEIAVQVDGGDGPVWLVYERSGSAFEVLGCGEGADPPAAAELSAAACGS